MRVVLRQHHSLVTADRPVRLNPIIIYPLNYYIFFCLDFIAFKSKRMMKSSGTVALHISYNFINYKKIIYLLGIYIQESLELPSFTTGS